MKEDFAVLIDRGDGVRGAARIVDDFVSRENGIVMPLRPDRAAVPTSLQYGCKKFEREFCSEMRVDRAVMWIRPPAAPPAQTTRFLDVLVSVYESIPEKSFRSRNDDNKGYRVSQSQPTAVVLCDLASEAIANPVDRRRRGALGDCHVVTACNLDET